MGQARGIAAAVALGLFGLPAGARANDDFQPYLDCAALFMARSSYIRGLDYAPEGHLAYLKQQANYFLSVANALAPEQRRRCDRGLAVVTCISPANLESEQLDLARDMLLGLVEQTGGHERLPPCIEDEACSACLRLPYPEKPHD
jgi:hypothetical protein